MTKKIATLLTTAALACGVFAAEGTGDIYDIRPFGDLSAPEDFMSSPYDWSKDNPLGSGKTVRFALTLVSREKNPESLDEADRGVFTLDHVGVDSEVVDDALNPLMIGIYVSGELRFAKLVGKFQPGRDVTRLVFEYTTQPGDFARPIKLADSSGKAVDENATNPEYFFYNTDKWRIRYRAQSTETSTGTKSDCNFVLMPSLPYSSPDGLPSGLVRSADYSLSKADFYVKTIDFADDWEEEDVLWHSVPEGTTKKVSLESVGDIAATNAVTLYVWSDDESIVKIKDGEAVYLQTGIDSSGNPVYATEATTVGSVTIQGGTKSATFTIAGVAQSSATANLVLSAWKGYNWKNSTNERLDDEVLTVPVMCTEPPPPSIQLERQDGDVITVDENPSDYKTTLKLTASAGYTGDFTVTITPRLQNTAATATWDQYVHLAGDSTSTSWLLDSPLTLTFTGGTPDDAVSKTVYVYGLGADQHTSSAGSGIFFEVTDVQPAAAAAYFGTLKRELLYFSPKAPQIVSPTASDTIRTVGNVDCPFSIKITDNYKNISDATGYTIYYKRTEEDVEWTKLDGAWKPNASGVLCSTADGSTLPKLRYVEGTFVTSFKVLTPGGDIESDATSVTVVASAPARAQAFVSEDGATYSETGSFAEGSYVTVKATISRAYAGGDVYAFLKPIDDATTNRVDGDCVSTAVISQGLKILSGDTESEPGAILIKDGAMQNVGGSILRFEVVLCSSSTYSAESEISGYQSKNLQVRAVNVVPTIEWVDMDGYQITADKTTFTDSDGNDIVVSKDVEKSFTFSINEPSSVDLNAATTNDQFYFKYTIQEPNGGGTTNAVHRGNPNDFVLKHKFSQAGKATIILELMDKDMYAYNKKYGERFTFYVQVADKPAISVTSDNGTNFKEGEIGLQKSRMHIVLGQRANVPLAVELSVKSGADATTSNKGTLELGGLTEKEGTNDVYTATLSAGQTDLSFYIARSDGTQASALQGFTLTAKVVSETVNADGIAWKDFYLANPLSVTIENVPPTISTSLGEENTETNAMIAAIGSGDAIRFSVSDVAIDLADGLKVAWTSPGATLTETYTNSTERTFTPVFKNPGVVQVSVTVTDKEGEFTQKRWYFEVTAAKTLTTVAHGPSGGDTSSALSQHYTKQPGIGKGHVWADSTFSTAQDFILSWNCGLSQSTRLYARGYKVGDKDDGNLNDKRDIALNKKGNDYSTGDEYYTYPDTEKDSYFYAWLQISREAGSSSQTTTRLGSIAPERNAAEVAQFGTVTLPTETLEDGSYADTFVEAIFSKEYLPSDDMGDINQDGVPDVYLQHYGFGIVDAEGVTGDDTADLSKYNDDGDFLPNMDTAAFASWIPGLSNTWVTVGRQFDAKTEIRGYGEALNDAPGLAGLADVKSVRNYKDPALHADSTLTDLEWWAYTNYCATALNTTDYDDVTNWAKWSPERPTDPTKLDTDGDGFPDGYEYYIWYRAHVGYKDKDGKFKKLTGRRYRPEDPMHPEIISSEEIAALYDPRHDLSGTAGPGLDTDTDNDGIIDLLELELGTNPFDFDTDGDGLPDGYEVAISMTDPLKATSQSSSVPDGLANPDGDAMAFATVNLPMVGFTAAGSDEVSEYWFGDNAWSLFSTDAAGADLKVCYFANGAVGEKYLVTDSVVKYKKDDEAQASIVTSSTQAYESWATGTVGKVTFYYPNGAATIDLNGKALDYAKPTELGSGGIYKAWDYDKDTRVVSAMYDDASAIEKILNRTVATNATAGVTFMHFQVYQKFGYNPLTATHWDLKPNPPWAAVNTKQFTNYDEYMLMTFLYHQGLISPSDLVQTSAVEMPAIWKKFTTDPLKADSFGHDIPDGWELYTFYGPGKAPKGGNTDYLSTLAAACPVLTAPDNPDPDKDGLSFAEEFAGILSSGFYPQSDYCTIAALNEKQKKWRNKLWATDPWNADTDGDGIKDGDEYAEVFVYGDSGVAGGGLNPLSWDTDGDGLPDPWELEFAGTYGGTTSSDSTNTTSTASTGWNNDGMDGTVNDAMLDYDNDGLLNWQEYMVGAMRCWRYDDTVSRWSSHDFDFTAIPTNETSEAWGKFWYGVLVDEQNTADDENAEGLFNPHLVAGTFDGGSYFSLCTNAWDVKAYGKYYMFKDGVYHDLKSPPSGKYFVNGVQFNRFTYKAVTADDWTSAHSFVGLRGLYPAKYITCDPRMADTDGDGMDDYYEIFHGMNPLLGLERASGRGSIRDVVFESYDASQTTKGLAWSACENYWYPSDDEAGLHRSVRFKRSSDPTIGGGAAWDFEAFPWLTGLAAADPDGDNIRNAEESIMPQLQASSNYLHTDPTPLWMTDTSYPESFTRRFYMPPSGATAFASATGTFTYGGKVYRFDSIPGFTWDEKNGVVRFNRNFDVYTINNWHVVGDYFFSFEENEGYDSDHDFLNDYEEARGRTKVASDPQDSNDPLRRQAMWFGGDDDKSFLQSHVYKEEATPVIASGAEFRENFLYYTVECWAKPDESILGSSGLRTLVERAIWTSPSGPADMKYLRKNFLIGIKNGKWYTKYDSAGTDKLEPVEITGGPVATTDWTHVAATYDGKVLRLYVNGESTEGMAKNSSVQPEHGFLSRNVMDTDSYLNYTYYLDISYLVGASALDGTAIYFNLSQQEEYSTLENPTFDNYGNYYKGYIDEVRIWDGARSAADIAADVKNRTRYTPALASANRQAVYEAWREGGTRQDGSVLQLPAELKFHWSFDHLPGAVEKGDVMTTPTGFTTKGNITDAKAVWVRPEDWQCPWWSNVTVRSTVYTDAAYVPWINNTVSHLPRIDGTTLDSVYWSTNFAGAVSAVEKGYPFFAFPRSAEVYSRWTQVLYDEASVGFKTTPTRWNLASTNDAQREAYRFACRDRNVLGDDLLPMGGAYPKRISSAEGGMWDNQGAADAWAQTGLDKNNRGLPDWWTLYAKGNYVSDPSAAINWETMVEYDGVRMTAWEAYLRDLARGMLPDGEYHPEYVDTCDLDGDRIPDWWEKIYGIDTGSAEDQFADADGDGLSNYAEYLISEVFKFARLNPTLAKTDGVCPDYFRRVGDLYLGEIFTDFDQVSDSWERQYAQADANGVVYANQFVHDPLKDLDNDGWSNFAEAKAGTNPTKAISSGTGDGYFIREYPVPTIDATVVYNEADVISAPIVFKAWSKKTDPGMTTVPDAIWSVANVSSNIESLTHTRYLGMNPREKKSYTLGSGMVTPGTVKIYFRDLCYRRVSTLNGYDNVVEHGEVADATWEAVVSDQWTTSGGELYALITSSLGVAKEILVGSIDYTTGEMTIDFGNDALTGYAYFVDDSDDYEYRKFYLAGSYVYISWTAETAGPDASGTYHLSEANGSGSQRGYVREGLNKFIAFVDNDGDGEYTPGEPFGFVDNVDVGWNGARFTVELTKTHPIFARIDLRSGDCDRAYHWTRDVGIATNTSGIVLGDSARKERVRVVRTSVNGYGLNPSDSRYLNIERRVVMDKVFDLSVRSFLHEGDFLDDDNFDLDWVWFEKDEVYKRSVAKKIDPYDVYYSIVFGNDAISMNQTNGLFRLSVIRGFDAADYQCQPTNVASAVEGIFYNSRPTFAWTMGRRDTYTAFRVQMADENGVVYDSGIRHAPAVDQNNIYRWGATCSFGDQTPQGKILSRRGNYKWRVAMYNAKFRTEKWSDWSAFSSAVNSARAMNDHGYSSIDVVVKYAGPSNVLDRVDMLDQTNGIIRVQAFPTADFSGEPLAQTFVTNVLGSSITDMSFTQPNARLTGLPANGTYYIRAYIDSDGDFQRSAWESWGCAADAVVLADTDVTAPVVNVYIEDADTDGDWIPDAYEYAKAGWTGSWESVKDKIQSDVTGDEKVLIDIEAFITDRGGLSDGMSGIPYTIFQNGSYAKILLGLTGGSLTTESLCAAVRSQSTIDANSLKITSLTLDPAANSVVLTVAADVQPSVAGQLVSQVYGLSVSSKTVSVRVYEKKTLAEAGWTLKTTVSGVEVGNGQTVVEAPLDPSLDFSSGFYKVEVVEE